MKDEREDKHERTTRLRGLIGKRKAGDKARKREAQKKAQSQGDAQEAWDVSGVQGLHEAL